MYKVKLTSKAKKQLKLLKEKYRIAISLVIEELKQEPFIGKPLVRELFGYYSYRIGVHRIIYTVNKKDKVITVLSAGHRGNVYN